MRPNQHNRLNRVLNSYHFWTKAVEKEKARLRATKNAWGTDYLRMLIRFKLSARRDIEELVERYVRDELIEVAMERKAALAA